MGQTLIVLYGVSGVLDVTGNATVGITGEIEVHVERRARSQATKVDARLAEIRHEIPACVRENCASDAGWSAFLKEHHLTPERVESYLRYQGQVFHQRFDANSYLFITRAIDYFDFAARAGGDSTEVAWAPFDGLDTFALWSEALRVIARARALLE